MKRILQATLPFLLLTFAGTAMAAPVTYALDPNHTDVHFSWNHFGFSNPSADLSGITGTLTYDPDHPARASVTVTMPLSGLETHVAALDKVLRGKHFFNAARYPKITFKSTKVEAVGYHLLRVKGTLTAHGISKPVTLTVRLNRIGRHPFPLWHGAKAIGFEAWTILSRSAFGLGAYAPAVSDQLKVHLTTEGIEKKAFDKLLAEGKHG